MCPPSPQPPICDHLDILGWNYIYWSVQKSLLINRKTSLWSASMEFNGGFQSHRATPQLSTYSPVSQSIAAGYHPFLMHPRGVTSSDAPALGHADGRCREGQGNGETEERIIPWEGNFAFLELIPMVKTMVSLRLSNDTQKKRINFVYSYNDGISHRLCFCDNNTAVNWYHGILMGYYNGD